MMRCHRVALVSLIGWVWASPASAHPATRQLQRAAKARGLRCAAVPGREALRCAPKDAGKDPQDAVLIDIQSQVHNWDRAAPSGRAILLDQWAGWLPAAEDWGIPRSWADAAPLLTARVRLRAAVASDPSAHTTQDLGELLVMELVLGGTNSVRSLPSTVLADWGITGDLAWARAATNLGGPLKPVQPDPEHGEGITVVRLGEGRDADALLALQLSSWGPGQPVALARAPEELLLTTTDNIDGMEALLQLAEAPNPFANPLSHWPLVWTGQAWEDWVVSQGAVLAARWARVHSTEKSVADALQVQSLPTPRGAHHATLDPVEQEGMPGTLTMWTPEATTLPEADWLVVTDPRGRRFVVLPWAEAWPLCRPYWAPIPDTLPARFAQQRPLDAAVFDALHALAPDSLQSTLR